MYDSPIKIIQTQIQMQMDGEILKAVQGVGIDVNKEELVKALAYDRKQYVKGYKDGVKEFAERLKATFPDREDKRCTLDDCYTLDLTDRIAEEMVGGENA